MKPFPAVALKPSVAPTGGFIAPLAGSGVVVGVALALYAALIRPWQLRWGATDEEVAKQMPGDDIVERPTFTATRALTIDASPDYVWPWLVQIGFGRAGWYSYDLLDNLGRHSAEQVIPSMQTIKVGDVVPMGPGGAGLRVKDLKQGSWLLWWDGVGYSTWLWSLKEIAPGRTRLVTRLHLHYRWSHPSILFSLLLIEPMDFPMMRKCMRGIKRRAESAHQRDGLVRVGGKSPDPDRMRSKRGSTRA
jgi:hypothetical protein